jgi:oligopeptidase A
VVEQLKAPMEEVSWDSFVAPLEKPPKLLGRAWGIVSHLNNVVDTPELRAVYNENQPKVTEFWTELGQNEALFAKYKRCAPAEFASLSPARKRIVDNAIRDRMGGAELPEDKKERFAAIQEEHAAVDALLRKRAGRHQRLQAAGRDEAELAGLPDDVKAAARAAAEKAGKPSYEFSLHFPSYYPILQFADSRALRETIYRANATKASEQGEVFSKKEDWDNTRTSSPCCACATKRPSCSATKLRRSVAGAEDGQVAREVIAFLEDLASARAVRREGPGRTETVRPRRTGHRRPAGMGCALRFRKAAGTPLRLLGTGSEAVLP